MSVASRWFPLLGAGSLAIGMTLGYFAGIAITSLF